MFRNKAGQFLKEMKEQGIIGKGIKSDKLSDFGVETHESKRWQEIADKVGLKDKSSVSLMLNNISSGKIQQEYKSGKIVETFGVDLRKPLPTWKELF